MVAAFSPKNPVSPPSVAIVHDSFFIRGGAERMNVEISKILGADIFAAAFRPESYDLRAMGFTGRMTEIFPSFRRGMLGFILMKFAFLLRCWEIGKYPTVIFSNEAISARVWARKAKKIYYAHSISRHLFDQKAQYVQKVPAWLQPLFSAALLPLKWWYISDLRAMDLILANSVKNADFLRSLAPDVRVEVLYPPVNTEEFYPVEGENSDAVSGTSEKRGNSKLISSTVAKRTSVRSTRSGEIDEKFAFFGGSYFLSYARLSHAKRIDVIIRAFLRLPEKRLKVLYGKNDPQLEEFRALAGDAPNIEFVTLTDNSLLPSIVRRATAVVCVSKNEDFGLVTVESMASGVPVVAVAEGGYLETVIDGKTGILLPPDFSVDDLMVAVEKMTPEFAFGMRDDCSHQAKKFSLDDFEKELRKFLLPRKFK